MTTFHSLHKLYTLTCHLIIMNIKGTKSSVSDFKGKHKVYLGEIFD